MREEWAWYVCRNCGSRRWMPTHWRFHTCEPCSPKHGTVQMQLLDDDLPPAE